MDNIYNEGISIEECDFLDTMDYVEDEVIESKATASPPKSVKKKWKNASTYRKQFDNRARINRENWTDKLSAALIAQVERHPIIWDIHSPCFRKIHLKNRAWTKVRHEANLLHIPDAECRRKWQHLSSNHHKLVMQCARVVYGEPANRQPNWTHWTAMEFLRKRKTQQTDAKDKRHHHATIESIERQYLDVDDDGSAGGRVNRRPRINRNNWNRELSSKLIANVELHPVIWDANSTDFRIKSAKDVAWTKVRTAGDLLQIPDAECRRKWQHLCSNNNKLHSAYIVAGESAENQPNWVHWTAMEFARKNRATFKAILDTDIDASLPRTKIMKRPASSMSETTAAIRELEKHDATIGSIGDEQDNWEASEECDLLDDYDDNDDGSVCEELQTIETKAGSSLPEAETQSPCKRSNDNAVNITSHQWNTELVAKLIALVELHPAIWDANSADYGIKSVDVHVAWTKVRTEANLLHIPDAECRRMWQKLCYNNSKLNSAYINAGERAENQPNWVYWTAMKFVRKNRASYNANLQDTTDIDESLPQTKIMKQPERAKTSTTAAEVQTNPYLAVSKEWAFLLNQMSPMFAARAQTEVKAMLSKYLQRSVAAEDEASNNQYRSHLAKTSMCVAVNDVFVLGDDLEKLDLSRHTKIVVFKANGELVTDPSTVRRVEALVGLRPSKQASERTTLRKTHSIQSHPIDDDESDNDVLIEEFKVEPCCDPLTSKVDESNEYNADTDMDESQRSYNECVFLNDHTGNDNGSGSGEERPKRIDSKAGKKYNRARINRNNWNTELTAKLISLVKLHPVIWDIHSAGCRNNYLKNPAWMKVRTDGNLLHISDAECRRKWQHLTSNNNKLAGMQKAGRRINWIHWNAMKFTRKK